VRFGPYLSMPRRLIFDSSVYRGIPSFAAAPEGSEIRLGGSLLSTGLLQQPAIEEPF